MDLLDVFWNYSQQVELQEQSRGLDSAQNALSIAESRIATLERRVDIMSTALETLVDLLSQKMDISTVELKAALEERLAAPVGTPMVTCGQCKHVNRGERSKCMYCGAPLTEDRSA